MLTVRTLFKKGTGDSGFTLVELMIVIAVIAILSTLAFFGLRAAQASARDVARVKTMNQVRASLEQYYSDRGTYPVLTNDFLTLVGSVAATPYLNIRTTITDPGCGTGTTANPPLVTTGIWNPTAVGGCSFGVPPGYQYTGTATAYTLTLTKEGGSSQTFVNP